MEGIEIRITGNNPLETLSNLAAFGMRCLEVKEIAEAASRILENEIARENEKRRETAAVSDEKLTTDFLARAKERDRQAASGSVTSSVQPAPVTVPPVAPAAPAPAAAVVPPAAVPAPVATSAPVFVPAPLAAPTAPVPGQMTFGTPAPTAAPKYTVEDITRAGAEFLVAHPEHQNAMYSLLPQFGIAALSELQPEQMSAFAAAMRSLGVKI